MVRHKENTKYPVVGLLHFAKKILRDETQLKTTYYKSNQNYFPQGFVVISFLHVRLSQKSFTSLHRSWCQAGHALRTQSITVWGLFFSSHSLLVLPSLNLQYTCRVLCPWPHVTEHLKQQQKRLLLRFRKQHKLENCPQKIFTGASFLFIPITHIFVWTVLFSRIFTCVQRPSCHLATCREVVVVGIIRVLLGSWDGVPFVGMHGLIWQDRSLSGFNEGSQYFSSVILKLS